MKRNSFLTLQKRYKKLLKYKRKIYEEDIINKMENLYYRNKDDFWKMLKWMKHKDSNEDVIPIAKLNNDFQNLYNKEMNPRTINQIKSKIQNCNKKTDIDHVIVQTTNLYTIPVKPNTQNSQRQNKERTEAKKGKK